MIKLVRISDLLWDVDPGYFRFKHAIKTVLAILVTLWVVRNQSFVIMIVAAIVCGFSMQPVIASRFSAAVLQVLAFDLAYFFAFILGLSLRDSADLRALVFVVLGFSVNYLRRFGLQNSLAPMMIWVLCFMATILPLRTLDQDLDPVYGLLTGLIVSALVLLLVFPDNYPRLFVNNSNRLFKAMADGLTQIRRHVFKDDGSFDFERESFVQIKNSLDRLLGSNQKIEEQNQLISEDQRELLSDILIHEYALVHAYNALIDAYRILRIHHYQLPQSIRISLIMINKHFASLLASLKMSSDYTVHCEKIAVSLAKLNENLIREHLKDPGLVMIILNLKLSFNLFNQHVGKLVRGLDED